MGGSGPAYPSITPVPAPRKAVPDPASSPTPTPRNTHPPVQPTPVQAPPTQPPPTQPSSYGTRPTGNVPMSGMAQLTPTQVQQVKKYCKFASSALDYGDNEGAVDFMEKSLRLLRTGKEWHHIIWFINSYCNQGKSLLILYIVIATALFISCTVCMEYSIV